MSKTLEKGTKNLIQHVLHTSIDIQTTGWTRLVGERPSLIYPSGSKRANASELFTIYPLQDEILIQVVRDTGLVIAYFAVDFRDILLPATPQQRAKLKLSRDNGSISEDVVADRLKRFLVALRPLVRDS